MQEGVFKEFDDLCRQFNDAFAEQVLIVQDECDREFGKYIYLGSEVAREASRRQWDAAKKEAIERKLEYWRKVLEISVFGLGGRHAAYDRIKAQAARSILIY